MKNKTAYFGVFTSLALILSYVDIDPDFFRSEEHTSGVAS